MRLAALSYTSLSLFDDNRPKRILNVGCATGYFLAVCRHQGHDILGVDLDDEPLYNAVVDYLGLPRTVHRVTSDTPLPKLDGTFDIITAFEVVFSYRRPSEESPWTASNGCSCWWGGSEP